MHRALDGDGPVPLEWLLSRLCEEFHCLPSAAWREWQRVPHGLLETMLGMRAYARAKARYDARGEQRPADPPLTALVTEISFALVTEAQEEEAARYG